VISSYPLCRCSHTYQLAVTRNYIVKMIVENQLTPETPRQRKYTRVFPCPEKNIDFQAVIILYETSDDSIKSVKVEGLLEE